MNANVDLYLSVVQNRRLNKLERSVRPEMGILSRVENRRSGLSLPVATDEAALGRTDVTIGIAKSVAASRARQTTRTAVETPLILLGACLKGAHV